MITSQARANAREAMSRVIRGSAGAAPKRTILPRVVVALLMLAAMLGIGSARNADAAEQVPFSATFATAGMGTLCGPLTFCLSVQGSGEATHLGRATISRSIVATNTLVPCLDVPGGTIRSFTDTLTLTAANGDTITMSGSGSSCANGIDVVSTGTYAATGGTGRFSGASGTMTLHIARFSPDPEITILTGTISSSGSLK